jgi:hypothetical protein
MTHDCKQYRQHCLVCNIDKPDRRGGVALQHLEIPTFPWEIVRIEYVTVLPKRAIMVIIQPFILCIITYIKNSLSSMS